MGVLLDGGFVAPINHRALSHGTRPDLGVVHIQPLAPERKLTEIKGFSARLEVLTRSLGLILVTNNMRELQHVPGLRVEDWVNHT